jgi:hypothetical protein
MPKLQGSRRTLDGRNKTHISRQARNFLSIPTSNQPSIGPWSSAPFGEDIAVQIDADYQPMVPATFGILPSSLHLKAKSVMRSEAN